MITIGKQERGSVNVAYHDYSAWILEVQQPPANRPDWPMRFGLDLYFSVPVLAQFADQNNL